MKKIGICTLYHSYNFGAFLQAFSLQEFLKSKGYDVGFVKLKDSYFEKFIYLKSRNIKKILYNLQQAKYFEKNFKTLNFFDDNSKYDVAIVGSDEIWNVMNPSFKHHNEFFGKNLTADKIIAYAPSCNNVTKQQLKSYNNELDFSKFKSISVRDINTQSLVKKVSNKNAEIVLDPTFLCDDFDKYVKKVPADNYIAVYGYEFSYEQILKVKKFARLKKLKLISLGLYNDWCDENIKIDSFEFLSYIKNSKYVVTSTFHGTVFSILLEKNFITFSNNKSKIKYLLEEFNLMDRDFTDSNLNCIPDVNYIEVNKIKNKLASKSKKWLIDAIEK